MSASAPMRYPPVLLAVPLLLIFGGVIGVGGYIITAATVNLTVDGKPYQAHTHQPTVAAFLSEAGVQLENADTITPDRSTPIRSGLTISVQRARPVVIDTDGQPQRYFTQFTSAAQILAEAGITPAAHAVMQPLPNTDAPTDLVIRTAQAVTLIDAGQTRMFYSTALTVGGALLDDGVALYAADQVTPALDTPLTPDGSTIRIARSQPVLIAVDGRTLNTRTHAATVGDALTDAGIALVGLDRAEPDLAQSFVAGMTITVERITESDESQSLRLPFRTVTQTDPSLPAGTQRVIQAGVDGVQIVQVRVRRENGVEVSRSAPLNWQIQPPVDQIVAISSGSTATP